MSNSPLQLTQDLFRSGKLLLKFVVKSDNSFRFKSYRSGTTGNSYANIQYSTYFVIEYAEYASRKKNTSPTSVYFSYPNMYELKNVFSRAADFILKNESDIYSESDDPEHGYFVGINPKYQDTSFKIHGSGNKSILIKFDILENENKNILEKAVRLIIADEGCEAVIPLHAFLSLESELYHMSLTIVGQQLVTMFLSSKHNNSTSMSKNVEEG